jgi:tyrosyl-tRNA synthetase
MTPSLFADLEARGLVHQCTEQEVPLAKVLDEPQVVYAGFDPTATSLHVGNLVPLLGLRRFQAAGHRVIALAGGATGMVGDPSGRSDERNLLTREALEDNVRSIKRQLEMLLDFTGANPAMLTDNIEWTADVTLLDFLRDVGKEFSVNAMIKKDSVRSRLEREGAGISFTEFSYMLLQAFDFYVLARDHGCTLQVGGSDQWGNITAGTELIRRKLGRPAYGLTFPLLLNADGSKFGKTAKGAVWLDPKRTSPFAFRQFWFKTSDAEVIPRMKYFSFIPIGEIQAIEAAMPAEPNAAQRRLAVHMTEIVHGREESLKVERAAEILFDPNGDLAQVPAEYLADAFDGAPVVEMARARFEGDGVPIVDLVSEVVHGGGNTRGAAKKDIEGKAIAVNGKKIDDREARVTASALLHAQYLVLRKGKRNQFLVKAI